jgi:hypothetical protein
MTALEKYIAKLKEQGWTDEKIARAQKLARGLPRGNQVILSSQTLSALMLIRSATSYQNQSALIEKYGRDECSLGRFVSAHEFRGLSVGCWSAAIGKGMVVC